MRRILLTVATAALALGVLAGPVDARPAGAGQGGKPAGIACQQAGIGVLRSLGAVPAAAQGTLDYKPFVGPDGIRLGPIAEYLGLSDAEIKALEDAEEIFLPFSLVLETHRNVPAAYAWCD